RDLLVRPISRDLRLPVLDREHTLVRAERPSVDRGPRRGSTRLPQPLRSGPPGVPVKATLVVEMYLNNGLFYVGSTEWPDLELHDGLDESLAANDTHLLLKAISQTIPVRVSVCNSHGLAPRGHLIYDGTLVL